MALRSVGAGKRVSFVQFLKDGTSSEIRALKRCGDIDYHATGTDGFIGDRAPTPREMGFGSKGLLWCFEALERGYDLIIADEILNAWGLGIVTMDDLKDLIAHKPPEADLVMTGRPCPKEILSCCGYATEFEHVAHPYDNGREPRKGIDY